MHCKMLFSGSTKKAAPMRTLLQRYRSGEKGAIGYVLLWLLGIPIPVLLVIFLVRGCT
jgi:hypothetical protein